MPMAMPTITEQPEDLVRASSAVPTASSTLVPQAPLARSSWPHAAPAHTGSLRRDIPEGGRTADAKPRAAALLPPPVAAHELAWQLLTPVARRRDQPRRGRRTRGRQPQFDAWRGPSPKDRACGRHPSPSTWLGPAPFRTACSRRTDRWAQGLLPRRHQAQGTHGVQHPHGNLAVAGPAPAWSGAP